MNLSKRQLSIITLTVLVFSFVVIARFLNLNYSNEKLISIQEQLITLERRNGEYLEDKVEEFEANFHYSLEARNTKFTNLQLNKLETPTVSNDLSTFIDQIKIVFFVSKNVCSSCREDLLSFASGLKEKLDTEDILLISDYSMLREFKAAYSTKDLNLQCLNHSHDFDLPLYFSSKPTFTIINHDLKILEYLKFNKLDDTNSFFIKQMINKYFNTTD